MGSVPAVWPLLYRLVLSRITETVAFSLIWQNLTVIFSLAHKSKYEFQRQTNRCPSHLNTKRRDVQIPWSRSSWWVHFLRWLLIFWAAHRGTCFISGAYNFEMLLRVLENVCNIGRIIDSEKKVNFQTKSHHKHVSQFIKKKEETFLN